MKTTLKKLTKIGIVLVLVFSVFFQVANAQWNSAPTVTTNNASNITETGAYLNGYVSTGALPTAWFEWGDNPNNLYNTTTPNTYGTYSTSFNAYISGLNPHTTYYFRAVARNSYDTVRGAVLSFSTGYQNQVYPAAFTNHLSATTKNATAISSSSAQINGDISNQTGLVTNVWFEWGTTTSLGERTTSVSIGNIQSVIHEHTIYGLKSSTTYYYRIVAENQNTRSVGQTSYFTTSYAPPAPTPPATVSTVSTTTTQVNNTYTVSANTPTTVYTIRNTSLNPNMTKTQANMALVINHTGDFALNEQKQYMVIWRNNNTSSVTRANLVINLPYSLVLESATGGTFNQNENTLTLDLGTLSAGEQGEITFWAHTLPNLDPNEGINTRATLIYRTGGVDEGVTTSVLQTITKNSALSANVLGSNIMPNNFFEWAIFIVLVFILIMLGMYLYLRIYPKKHVTVSHVIDTNSHSH